MLTFLLAILAGCGVTLDHGSTAQDTVQDAAVPNADGSVDGRPDAPPDARACAGGDAHMTDPNGACLVFFTGPKVRADAQASCVAIGAHLAIIKSAATNAVAATLAQNRDIFVGGTDLATEGTYLWPDGTGLTFTNWRAGEPNNAMGQFEEDCMILEGANGGTWDDRPCAPPPVDTGAYAYLCEY